MPHALSPDLDQRVRDKLSAGQYASEEEVLREALKLLDEHDETLAAVSEGFEDVRSGRSRSFEEADTEFRRKHNIPFDK